MEQTSSSQTSSTTWALPPRPTQPKTTDPAFIGHIFKHDQRKWRIHEKTANKRGSISWIWRHSAELWEANGTRSKNRIGYVIAVGTAARPKWSIPARQPLQSSI